MGLKSWLSRTARRARIEGQNIPVGPGRFLSLLNGRIIEPRLDLIVIGSGKCGTTSLHDWLDQHPDIFMSRPLKEPEYFLPESIDRPWRRVRRNRDAVMRYMIQDYRKERVFGEASTLYTGGGFYDANPIPALVRAHNPAMRLVYSVRNPLARVISHAQQDIHAGRLPPDLAVLPEERLGAWVRQSCYGRQLSHWLDLFPPEHVEVGALEEFQADPRPFLDRIAAVLGLDSFPPGFTPRRLNVTGNRAVAPKLWFTGDQYERAMELIAPDLDLLEQQARRPLRELWDLSRDAWVR